MLPVVAIVGRPNVGKSTLFNRLTRSREALVADEPGLTRDRRFGVCRAGVRPWVVVDTGGLSEEAGEMLRLVGAQSLRAVEESDLVLLLVDGREGLSPVDERIASRLRRAGKRLMLAVNKTEGREGALAAAEFHALGLGEPWPVSAREGHGVAALVAAITAQLPAGELEPAADSGTRVAIIGRPNVGKSTLVNRLLGTDRVLTHDQPGTTRDSVFVPFERHGQRYILIDTAGVRRRSRIAQKAEIFSVVKTLQALEAADVVIFVADAREGVTDQDASLLGQVVDAGRALVIAVNKWDGLGDDQRRAVRESVARKLAFVDFAVVHYISALHGSGVGGLMEAVDQAWECATRRHATHRLTSILATAVQKHAPPLVRGRRIKLRYAHQGGQSPPTFIVHGNQTEHLPEAYRRYLANAFRDALGLSGTPVRLELRSGKNPYAGRRNTLTPHQQRKRRRLLRHARGRD